MLLDKNLSKKTDRILFVKVNNDGFGLGAQRREIKENDLPLALEIIKRYKQSIIENKTFEFNTDEARLASLVEKTKIAESGNYDLSGDRYKESIVYSGKWDFVKLGDVCEVKKGDSITKKKATHGKIPVIAGGQQPAYYHNKSNRKGNVITVSASGAYAGFVNYFQNPIFASDCSTVQSKNESIANTKYIYQILKGAQKRIYNFQRGGGQPHVYPKDLISLKIPLPPLEAQEQTVAELDSYQKIIDGAGQVVENYKPTFKIDPQWEMVELGKLCDPEYGYSETAKDTGEYRYIRITDISDNGLLRNDDLKYVDLNKKSKNYILNKGDVLVARTGATYGKTLYFYDDIKAIFAGYLIRLNFDQNRVDNKFYWVFAQSLNYDKQKNSLVQGGGQPQFNANAIKQIKIPLPHINIQQQIVARIEKEQKAVEATKDLITLFEQKIKDKISDVWGE